MRLDKTGRTFGLTRQSIVEKRSAALAVSFSLILRTSFLFDGYIIPNFNPHDRDKITMPKLIVALLRKKQSARAFCDFITDNKISSGYTVIKQNERGWHNGSYEYKLKEAQGND